MQKASSVETPCYYTCSNVDLHMSVEALPDVGSKDRREYGLQCGFEMAPRSDIDAKPAATPELKAVDSGVDQTKWWIVDERGTWVADYRAGFIQTELWGAMDCLIKLDQKMCTDFGQQYRSWFVREFPTRSVVEFTRPPNEPPLLDPSGEDYYNDTVLSKTSEAGTWNQREVELARREVIHYMQQPALPFTTSPTGAETAGTDLTGLRGERADSQRLVLRGIKMLARNYWTEALTRFASQDFQRSLGTPAREKLKAKMRRTMRKLCQRIELLSMLMPHPQPGNESDPPHREALEARFARIAGRTALPRLQTKQMNARLQSVQ